VGLEARNQGLLDTLVQVKGWNGETLQTTSPYAAFASVFEGMKQSVGDAGNWINCSEGGMALQGYAHLPFTEAIAQADLSQDAKALLTECLERHYKEFNDSAEAWQQLNSNISGQLAQIESLLNKAKDNIRRVKRLESKLKKHQVLTPSILSDLAVLQRTDAQLQEESKSLKLINHFIKQELFIFARNVGRRWQQEALTVVTDDSLEVLFENLAASFHLYASMIKGSEALRAELEPWAQQGPLPNRAVIQGQRRKSLNPTPEPVLYFETF
jgi:hypothetical protein